ncbi:MAG: alpha/beta hydrolase [Neisseriaceae bacterium]|nr:alpha/beta hydrolase [Neisseriaceae bacterium]MBP6862808.1 alpha/beta hydrolase [Neisseriaceae bacterium]
MTLSDDLLLLGIADASVPRRGFWLDTWLRSYPTATDVVCASDETAAVWQARLNQVIDDHKGPVFLVAHGVGVQATLAWVAQASLRTQGRVKGAILAAPITLPAQDAREQVLARARAGFPTALVCSDNDAFCTVAEASRLAQRCGAKLMNQGDVGHMTQGLGSWQWGMKLMQEMLLA